MTPRVTVAIHDGDNDIEITPQLTATEIEFSERLNAPAGGRFRVPLAVPADIADVTDGRVVRFKVDGTTVVAGTVKRSTQDAIPSSGAARFLTVEAPGLAAEWADAPVLPPPNTDRFGSITQRIFDWSCLEVDDSVAPWTTATTGGPVRVDRMPRAFPSATALRVWSGSAEKLYCRVTRTNNADKIHAVYFSGSGIIRQRIQGVPIQTCGSSTDPAERSTWRAVPKTNVNVPIVWGWEVDSAGADDPYFGAVGWKWDGGVGGTLEDPIDWETGTTAVRVSTVAQGPTPGRIIRALLEEAQAAGFLAGWTLDFDDDDDTAGNPWPHVTEVALTVGDSCLTALERLAEAWIDFAVDPTTKTLSAWRWRERGNFHTSPGSRPVLWGARWGTGTGTPNIAELSYERAPEIPSAIFVRSRIQQRLVGTGSKVAYLDLFNVLDDTAAEQVAQAKIDDAAERGSTTVIARVQPTGSGDVPWVDFGIGDAVDAPDRDGVMTTYRCVGITARSTAGGSVRYTVELGAPLFERQSSARRWLQTADPGMLGGQAISAGGTNPGVEESNFLGAGIPTGRLEERVIGPYDQLSTLVETGFSRPWPMTQPTRIHRWVATLTYTDDDPGPSTTDTVIRVWRDGVHVASFTLDAGAAEVFEDDMYVRCGGAEIVQLEVQTAGAGAANLAVTLYGTDYY